MKPDPTVTPSEPFPPIGLNRSGIACWFSLLNLIREKPFGECYFWTITSPDVCPYWSFGIRHSWLLRGLRDDVRAGRIEPWGGVRIFEPHPGNSLRYRFVDGGHGLHAHWCISGRLPIEHVLRRAKQSCLGRIHVDKRPAGLGLPHYMAKYLIKSRNMPMPGVRRWANIGGWEGTQTRDIEISSDSIEVFKAAHREAKAAGKPNGACWTYAKVTQRNFDLDICVSGDQ